MSVPTKNCNSCGASNPYTARFCRQCGTGFPLERTKSAEEDEVVKGTVYAQAFVVVDKAGNSRGVLDIDEENDSVELRLADKDGNPGLSLTCGKDSTIRVADASNTIRAMLDYGAENGRAGLYLWGKDGKHGLTLDCGEQLSACLRDESGHTRM